MLWVVCWGRVLRQNGGHVLTAPGTVGVYMAQPT